MNGGPPDVNFESLKEKTIHISPVSSMIFEEDDNTSSKMFQSERKSNVSTKQIDKEEEKKYWETIPVDMMFMDLTQENSNKK